MTYSSLKRGWRSALPRFQVSKTHAIAVRIRTFKFEAIQAAGKRLSSSIFTGAEKIAE
jgi:hypothetical protein